VNVEATTESPLATGADAIVIGVFAGEQIAHDVPDGTLQRLLDTGEARPDLGRLAVAHANGQRFVLVGLGPREEFEPERARVGAAAALGRAHELGAGMLCWEVPHHVDDAIVGALVEGTVLAAYRFDRYKPAEPPQLERLLISAHHDVSEPVRVASVVSAAQNRARDLGNTPANDLTPHGLAKYGKQLLGEAVTIRDEYWIRDEGMGAFTTVARGSEQGARLIRIDYDAVAGQAPLLALVGKAITFDSGGLSLKSAAGMQEMKFDMAGGAAVVEAIAALAELGAPVRVLGVVGAAENMPSGSATRPGDIARALDGTTIEIDNTDAEGRLVLADCLAYAIREGADVLVDIATLTGGVVGALGSTYAGLWANDEPLAARVQASSARTGELVWRLPLHPEYAEMIQGRYAQLTNRSQRREALPVTGAEFLHHFAGRLPWAHLDIAGTGFDAHKPYFDKGATGFGVRLLVDLARSF
jgi:leucyl aminopeptidase